MGPDVDVRNIERARRDERSLLSLYRRLIGLRRRSEVLQIGEYRPIRSRNDILAFERVAKDERLLIALNLVHQPRRLDWSGTGSLLLSTHLDREACEMKGPLLLREDEGVIVEVRS